MSIDYEKHLEVVTGQRNEFDREFDFWREVYAELDAEQEALWLERLNWTKEQKVALMMKEGWNVSRDERGERYVTRYNQKSTVEAFKEEFEANFGTKEWRKAHRVNQTN